MARRGKKCSPQSAQREPSSRGGSDGSSGTVKYPALIGTRVPAIVGCDDLFRHGTGRRRGRPRLADELVLYVVMGRRRRVAPDLGRHGGAPVRIAAEPQADRPATLPPPG